MASHGAAKEIAATEPRAPKLPKREVVRVAFEKAKDGSVVAHHEFSHFEHRPEVGATFGADELHKIPEHLSKHLGLKMPGRAEGTVASPKEGEAGE